MKLAKHVILVSGALAVAVVPALSERGHDAVSASRAFSIDGRRFLVQEAAGDVCSLVERELARRGIDTHGLSEHLASAVESRAVEPLREEQGVGAESAPPGGLESEHALRLETATGLVEIFFGHVAGTDKDIPRRFRSIGWECTETGTQGTPGMIAQLTTRKEASFVFLDKNQGRFLAIRRPVR